MYASQHGQAVPKPLKTERVRPRLRALLEEDGQVVALVAPSGYGKTTLLAQHARAPGRPVAWLSLQADDADPLQLGRSLAGSLGQLAGFPGLPAWERAEAAGAPAAEQARALARDLNGWPENLDLVLDGADVLGPEAGRWLTVLLGALGEGHRLLLSSYEPPPLELPRWVAAGRARVIGPESLAYTPEETREYLAGRGYPGDPLAAHGRLEGWPAGLALVASGALPGLTPQDLVRDVLSGLPEGVRAAAAEAAVAEVWNEGELRRLGCDLPPGWLRAMRRAGLPLTPLTGGTHRPHQLVLTVLDEELRARPERYDALHAAAGRAAEAAGDGWRALSHYVRAGAAPLAAATAGRLVARFEARWEYRLVRRVLEALPAPWLTGDLERALGHALFETGDAARGEVLLRRLRAGGRADPALLFSLGLLEARAGRHERQLALAGEGLARAGDEGVRRRLRRLRANALLELGQWPEGLELSLEVARQAEEDDDLVELGAALTQVGLAQFYLGHLEACEGTFRRALGVCEVLDMPSRTLWLQNDLANVLRLRGRQEDALEVLGGALERAEGEHNVMQVFLLETLGDLAFDALDLAAAADLFGRALERCPAFRLETLAPRLWPKLAETHLHRGDLAGADAALAHARQMVGASPEAGALAFAEGLLALAQGDLAAAEHHFDAAQGAGPDPLLRARAHLYAAETARRQARPAHAHLGAFLAAARALGPAALRPDAEVLAGLLGEDRDRAEAASPPWGGRLARPAGPRSGAPGPAELCVRTLGTLGVSIGGQGVHLARTKSGEILVWLALFGSGTRDQLVDALWDGSGERRHVEHFKVAVRQLRAALAAHPAVTFNPLPLGDHTYRLAPQFSLDLDASRARQALDSGRTDDLRRAVDAYRGPFLPAVETGWVVEARARLLEETVTAALALGTALEAAEPRGALGAYRRAVDLDPFAQEGHEGLIRVHEALGERAAARHAYLRYARLLADELGSEPSPELRRSFGEHAGEQSVF